AWSGGVARGMRDLGRGPRARRPPRVADAEAPGKRRVGDLRHEVVELPLASRDPHDAVLAEDRDPRRVVAAVFEALQPGEEDGERLLRADVADDAAHQPDPFFAPRFFSR